MFMILSVSQEVNFLMLRTLSNRMLPPRVLGDLMHEKALHLT